LHFCQGFRKKREEYAEGKYNYVGMLMEKYKILFFFINVKKEIFKSRKKYVKKSPDKKIMHN
jgi:hypothetical protein